jgi:23S rRNA (guanosine2251-2'-O)-methyltransferase
MVNKNGPMPANRLAKKLHSAYCHYAAAKFLPLVSMTSSRRPLRHKSKHAAAQPRRDETYKEKFRRDERRKDKSRHDADTRERRKTAPPAPLPPQRERDSVLLWGLHAVRAAWLNPKRRCYRLWMTEASAGGFEPILAEARDALLLKRPDPKRADRQELDRLTPPGSVHQGIVLETAPLPEPNLSDVIAGDTPPDLLIMLDQVTDPHNVGAILRSAAAFGAGAVIMTERNAPSVTGVLGKSASGALEHVPQIHVVNLARALDEVQQAGYWRVGLAEEGARDLGALDLTGRTVLVLGAEGEGLRQLTRKKCDELARLPTGEGIGSLNVSNAAAVALYEVRRQKKAFI